MKGEEKKTVSGVWWRVNKSLSVQNLKVARKGHEESGHAVSSGTE